MAGEKREEKIHLPASLQRRVGGAEKEGKNGAS
jgi:hypothetical protein